MFHHFFIILFIISSSHDGFWMVIIWLLYAWHCGYLRVILASGSLQLGDTGLARWCKWAPSLLKTLGSALERSLCQNLDSKWSPKAFGNVRLKITRFYLCVYLCVYLFLWILMPFDSVLLEFGTNLLAAMPGAGGAPLSNADLNFSGNALEAERWNRTSWANLTSELRNFVMWWCV